MKTLKAIYAKLTPSVRSKIYAVATLAGSLFVAHGIATADDVKAVIEMLGISLGVVGVPALAKANTPKP